MYKVYPDKFDFDTYDKDYQKVFKIRQNKDGTNNKNDFKLNQLQNEFMVFLNLPETQKIKKNISNFPKTFDELLVLKPLNISEIYLEFNKLQDYEKNNINSIKFDYDDMKARITNFFISKMKLLHFNTCFYCDTTYINFYKTKTGIIKKQFALDHFIPKGNCKIFSLCLYNLVPSCTSCNSGSKGNDFSYIDLSSCKTPSILAKAFPTSDSYEWLEFMKFKILPKDLIAISELLYSKNFSHFNIELESKNEIYEKESDIFEIIPKYNFFIKQFVTQIDKYRMYDKNFFYLISKNFLNNTAQPLYEALFNEKLRESNQLPFKKIYTDIRNIFK